MPPTTRTARIKSESVRVVRDIRVVRVPVFLFVCVARDM
jgi:hypothetical protein